jgi:ABC-2 type transport system permease protein
VQVILDQQTRAIIWAQWRSIFNRFPRQRAGLAFTWLFTLMWYGGFTFLGGLAAVALPEVKDHKLLVQILDGGLLAVFVYWQLMPLLMVSSGVSLDLKRLMIYPIAERRMFGIEVLLRASTGVEVLLVLTGTAIGLWRSPIAPWYGPLFFLPFIAFNLCLSAGVRDLLSRLMRKRGVREIVILGFVLLTQVPNFIVRMVPSETLSAYAHRYSAISAMLPVPWQWTGRLAAGDISAAAVGGLTLWVVLGAWFGYSQFRRGLRFDEAAAESANRAPSTRGGRIAVLDRIADLPLKIFPEPLATLVQKELLTLPRVPRFRMLFLMGAFFSLIVFVPFLSKTGGAPDSGFMQQNFLTIVVLYSMLLLTEPLFSNVFSYDRKATQAYYVLPVRFATVLLAKNLTAGLFIALEILLVCLVTRVFGIVLTMQQLLESLATVVVFAAFLLSIGNLTSIRYAKAVDASNPWRGKGSGKGGGLLMLVYLATAPAAVLAHLARYAFNSEIAFFAVLGAAFFIAVLTYIVTFDSALESADKDRERFLAALGEGGSVMG